MDDSDGLVPPAFAREIVRLTGDVGVEAARALVRHGPFRSAHEAYGVLLEEVEEFWDEVRKRDGVRSKELMRAELIQVAAVAIKAAASLT